MLNVLLVSHFYHEPPAREIGQPLPVYLTVNKLYLYLYLYIYSNGKLQVVVHFLKNSNVSVKKLKKDVPTTETQALNLKNSGGIFQVLPFRLEKIAKNELQFPCPPIFYLVSFY